MRWLTSEFKKVWEGDGEYREKPTIEYSTNVLFNNLWQNKENEWGGKIQKNRPSVNKIRLLVHINSVCYTQQRSTAVKWWNFRLESFDLICN